MSLNDIRAELKRSRRDLLSKANVVSIGIGYKTSKGKKTDQLSLICSVEQKKPKETLSEKDLIPSQINGILTDVVQSGIIKAFSTTVKRRPALGGDSIGHFAITAGTLGCTVRKNGQVMILSNNHVLANSNEGKQGDAILQPGAYDGGGLADTIANLMEWVPISFIENGLPVSDCPFAKGSAFLLNLIAYLVGSNSRVQAYSLEEITNLVDAALAKPLNDDDVSNEINGIGLVQGIKEGNYILNSLTFIYRGRY
jgi:hypothetical protein